MLEKIHKVRFLVKSSITFMVGIRCRRGLPASTQLDFPMNEMMSSNHRILGLHIQKNGQCPRGKRNQLEAAFIFFFLTKCYQKFIHF